MGALKKPYYPSQIHSVTAMFYQYKAIVREVYDGDTITVDIDLGLKVWVHGEKLRLHGINAPELRGDTYDLGLCARDYLRTLVLGQVITIVTKKDTREKYGRYLGDVFVGSDNLNVNEEMVRAGHAVHAKY